MSQLYLEPDTGSPPETPLWVKVFGIIIVVMILLVGIVHLTGHSPKSHMHHAKGAHQTQS